jgi:hypothetical protein
MYSMRIKLKICRESLQDFKTNRKETPRSHKGSQRIYTSLKYIDYVTFKELDKIIS